MFSETVYSHTQTHTHVCVCSFEEYPTGNSTFTFMFIPVHKWWMENFRKQTVRANDTCGLPFLWHFFVCSFFFFHAFCVNPNKIIYGICFFHIPYMIYRVHIISITQHTRTHSTYYISLYRCRYPMPCYAVLFCSIKPLRIVKCIQLTEKAFCFTWQDYFRFPLF